ncbi:unnamed protein product [Closterium sp. NIES-65]|nr:unnamed protein product [Closterium sp. NIES-65]
MDDNGEDNVYFGRALERAEGAGGRKLHLAVVEGRAKQAVPPITHPTALPFHPQIPSLHPNPPRLSARQPPAFICPPTPHVYLPANPPRLSARQPPAFICPPTPRVYLPANPPRLYARQPPAFICPPTPRVYLPANPPRLSARQPPAFICPPTPRVYLPANPSPSNPGWQPALFRSSRSQRAEVQPQRVEALMDADERHDAQRSAVAAHSAFDTFGFTAAERARHLAPAADRRHSVIPGGAVAELLAPAADSIGKALLRRMGWREGRGLGPDEVAASKKGAEDVRGQACRGVVRREEGCSFSSPFHSHCSLQLPRPCFPPSRLPPPCLARLSVLWGVGAEHRQRTAGGAREGGERGGERGLGGRRRAGGGKQSLFAAGSGRVAGGFGIGALEEAGAEDEDIYDSGEMLCGGVQWWWLRSESVLLCKEKVDCMWWHVTMVARYHVSTPSCFPPSLCPVLHAHCAHPLALSPRTPSLPVRPPPPCALSPRAPSPPVRPLPPCALSPRAPSPPVRPLPPCALSPCAPSRDTGGKLPEVASDEDEEGEGRGVHAGGAPSPLAPPPAPPSAGAAVRAAVEGVAAMVARCGAHVEALLLSRAGGGVGEGAREGMVQGASAREEGGGEGSARLAFLVGGEGSAYYRRRVWELAERQRAAQGRAAAGKAVGSTHPTPTSTASPAAAASAFTSAASPAAPPAPTAPAFQQHGAAAELAAMMTARFHSSGHEDQTGKGGMSTEKAALPATPGADTALAGAAAVVVARRREEAWRLLPLLCKRFNLPDPYAGKHVSACLPPDFPAASCCFPHVHSPSSSPRVFCPAGPTAMPAAQVVHSACTLQFCAAHPFDSLQSTRSQHSDPLVHLFTRLSSLSFLFSFAVVPPQQAPPPPLHRPSQLDTLTSFPQTLPSTTPAPTAAPSPLLSLPAPPRAAPAMPPGRDGWMEGHEEGHAIFSDDEDSDDDARATSAAPGGIDDVAAAEAATRALARLEAGDFLEGLGEELGLQVDPGEVRHGAGGEGRREEREGSKGAKRESKAGKGRAGKEQEGGVWGQGRDGAGMAGSAGVAVEAGQAERAREGGDNAAGGKRGE